MTYFRHTGEGDDVMRELAWHRTPGCFNGSYEMIARPSSARKDSVICRVPAPSRFTFHDDI